MSSAKAIGILMAQQRWAANVTFGQHGLGRHGTRDHGLARPVW
jgi:hypothetical protein